MVPDGLNIRNIWPLFLGFCAIHVSGNFFLFLVFVYMGRLFGFLELLVLGQSDCVIFHIFGLLFWGVIWYGFLDLFFLGCLAKTGI